MTTLGFPPAVQDNIFAILAAILHLGNIKFIKDKSAKNDASDIQDPTSNQSRDLNV
jgi:myosin heavy subunit